MRPNTDLRREIFRLAGDICGFELIWCKGHTKAQHIETGVITRQLQLVNEGADIVANGGTGMADHQKPWPEQHEQYRDSV